MSSSHEVNPVDETNVELLMRSRRRVGIIFVMVVLSLVLACAYVASRIVMQSMVWTSWSAGNVVSVLLLCTEAFVVFHSLSYALNFVSALKAKDPPRAEITDWNSAPSVAILVPARHEPYDVLERTFLCLKNIDYPNKVIYFLDDSSEESYHREAEELATTYGLRIFRRTERHGAKAGIINDIVRTLDTKYFVVFDADQNPMPGFLKNLVPIMEADPKLAFVQTPQFYTNTESSSIVKGANIQHCMFYEFICEGKSAANAMIFCGTNAILRIEALKAVGGLDEGSVTEDFATTIDWHLSGWKSLYNGQVGTFGAGPESLDVYLKQQWRWSRGNIGVLFKVFRKFFTNPFGMNIRQWWEHFATGSYYIIGLAYCVLMLCPITQIFFNLPVFNMNGLMYVALFAPYFLLSMTIFFLSMYRRNYKFGDLLLGILLGFICFPVYVKALLAALLHIKSSFNVTEKRSTSGAVPFRVFKPQLFMWAVNFAALIWGAQRMAVEQTPQLAVSMLWTLYHFTMLSSLFYFRVSSVDWTGDEMKPIPVPAG
ncbi:MAG: glycosyltransferase [Planctomycetes bacterium]|nr:glycosyltransferase [Planctomycetota bacterium]